jgi:hypothetical protein
MNRKLVFAAASAIAAIASQGAQAGTVDWTTWTSETAGSPGSASGTAGSVTVTYTGEVQSASPPGPGSGGPSWTPTGTWADGTVVGNAPTVAGSYIQLSGGGNTGTDTITFSKAVTNPVIAIWSLGQSGEPASFVFNEDEPVVIVAGGPNHEYGGAPITLSGSNTIIGIEGNGTVELLGTYTSIEWTTPQYENYYGFTVGVEAPEPATWALMLAGFAGLGAAMRASRRNRLAAA